MQELLDRLTTALSDRYAIEEELGAGGMATVYLAEDLKHHRKVALKVLRPELAAVLGPTRFIQEITTTANLQHPNIVPLFDSGQADSFLYYVMPYIQGETLRQKLNRETQLGIDEAVRITREVVDALDYAHRHDVIHRDIKPENILIHDGRPMVADFGIALAVSAAAGNRMTETGLSLGTPHYMSPEQATAEKELSARSDIYSLSAVLYEMLTGDPPHTGSSAQQIIMKILTEDAPAVTSVRKTVPPNVAMAVAQGLAKLPADRFESAAKFGEALANPSFTKAVGAVSAMARPQTTSWNPLSITLAATTVVLAVLVGWLLGTGAPERRVARFPMALPAGQELFFSGPTNLPRLDLSPDASTLVYMVQGTSKPGAPTSATLWLRSFGELEGRQLSGTEGGRAPAISPDGSLVAFITLRGGLRVASLSGGPTVAVLDSGLVTGPTWGADERIYYIARPGYTLRRVRVDGVEAETVLELDPTLAAGGFGFPDLVSGDRGIIVTAFPEDRSQLGEYGVHVIDLESGASMGTVAGVAGVYAESGHLVSVTADGTITAQRLDPGSLGLSGRAVALAAGADVRGAGNTDLAISQNGTLAYATPSFDTPEGVVWVSPSGAVEPVDPTWTDLQEYEGLALSPGGNELALTVQLTAREDVWIKELGGGPLSRLVPGGLGTYAPAWTSDGQSVTFVTESDPTTIYIKPADGSAPERELVNVGRPVQEMRWSRNGLWLLMSVSGPPSFDILAWRVDEDAPQPLIDGAFDEYEPALSADGRFLAYISEESGQAEVYVRPFPDVAGGRRQISTGGGADPVWSRTGLRLFFRPNLGSADGPEFWAANFAGGLRTAIAEPYLFLPLENNYEGNARDRLIDVAPDGRFVMIERSGVFGRTGDLVIVQNFFEELRGMEGNE